MKNNGKINLVLDFVMFLFILAIFFVKGEFHEALAYILGAMLILHLVLHWKQIKVLYCQLIPQQKYRYLAGIVAVASIAAILTMPLYVTTDEHGPGGEFGQHRFQQNVDFGPQGNQ
ncbi:MAG TPA: hypothetical protein PKW50_02950 [Syntrophomonas sp.]|nr:hypothetical protein [Syntrophomonas sp.]